MSGQSIPTVSDALIAELENFVRAGATQERLISLMRERGLSIIPSIRLVSLFYGLSTYEAKRLVHFSSTWADCLSVHDRLHDEAIRTAEELGEEDRSGAALVRSA